MKKLISILLACVLLLGVGAMAEGSDAVTGASQKVDESIQMTQEEIKALTLDYLRGWKLSEDENGATVWSYREMYQIATVHDGMPGLSSVEFVIDPETMRLYASSEKGTEKVQDIANNENVVLYWYHQIPEEEYVPQSNDYFNSYGVQIKGTARLMTGTEDNFYHVAALYLRTLYGTALWDAMDETTQKARIDMIAGMNAWIEIVPTEYIANTLSWSYNKENSRRPQFYDPTSPYFGKDVRQVYYVK